MFVTLLLEITERENRMFKYHCVFERIILKFVISNEIDFEIGNFWKFYIYSEKANNGNKTIKNTLMEVW